MFLLHAPSFCSIILEVNEYRSSAYACSSWAHLVHADAGLEYCLIMAGGFASLFKLLLFMRTCINV